MAQINCVFGRRFVAKSICMTAMCLMMLHAEYPMKNPGHSPY